MSNMALEPTYENLKKHYLNDTIGRNDDLFYFVRILSGLHSGSAVALNAAWGSGKTFFVKQAKMLIDIHNPNSDIDTECLNKEEIASIKKVYDKYNSGAEKYDMPKMATVYYDAWKYDDTEDPLLSLLYCIMNRFGKSLSNDKADVIKKFAKQSISILSSAARYVTGINVQEILETIKNYAEACEDTVKEQKSNESLEKRISSFLNDVVLNDEEKLVIFIDELDRCNPQYAVKLLERVKHYFNHPKVVFVVSYNKSELQHSIKTLYGSKFSADKYLERFFDYEFGLSTIDAGRYLDSLGCSNTVHLNMKAVANIYSFQMRELCKYYDCVNNATAMIKKLISKNIYSQEKSLEFCIIWFLPVIIGLRFYNENYYREFIEGKGFKYYEAFYDLRIRNKEHHFGQLISGLEQIDVNYNGIMQNRVDPVSMENKFRQLYTAIFKDIDKDKQVLIGNIMIDSAVKEEFCKIYNGISYLADYK